MSTFVLSKRSNDSYKFIFTSRKGNVIFTSLSYKLKFECEDVIELIKTSLHNLNFIKKKTSSGKFYFEIMLQDKIYGNSRRFTTLLLLQKGIDGIQKYVEKAEVLDFSNHEDLFC